MRVAMLVLLLFPSAYAQFGANATVTSDYYWRGISQTDENPALQLELDWHSQTGVYTGIWTSNVDFGDETDFEVDFWLGYKRAYDSGFSWDLGYVYYTFEGSAAMEFGEAYLGLNFKGFEIKYSIDPDHENAYSESSYTHEFGKRWHASARAGHYDFDVAGDYTDWAFLLGHAFKVFDVELAYMDTNIDDPPAVADARVVLSLSKSW
ncbi:Bacterial protein of unknown function (Gcw_chp) [Sulfidibacter corallicola]|uniref:Uncharacterized protein n=1 Tax=Sulfidibacter corallicola TaxID=2818388 RepID=A0A8A4TIE7_SULCO|nr:TorF family putative porin [Sulfidibacter corallicola]QTD48932.1 hypothetical protein J3U87_25390 [Sulfidibacter corallicola]